MHVTSLQFCQPPVPGTETLPISLPVGLSNLSSMVPPLVSLATLALKLAAPYRNLYLCKPHNPYFQYSHIITPVSVQASVSIPTDYHSFPPQSLKM